MSQMTRIKYLSSFDELTWRIDFGQSWIVRADIPWTARAEIRSWIENCCSDIVWIWNGTSKPQAGAVGWDNLIAAHESVTYLIFTHHCDAEMFLLKHATDFKAKYYGNDIYKAWHDSRSKN
jgi:hypothetical protein